MPYDPLDEPVRPGQRFLFRVSTPHAGYAVIAALRDDLGSEVEICYPKGPVSAAIEAGPAIDLPSLFEMEDSLGYSVRVYGFLCIEPISVEEVIADLKKPVGTYMAPGPGPVVPCERAVLRFRRGQ